MTNPNNYDNNLTIQENIHARLITPGSGVVRALELKHYNPIKPTHVINLSNDSKTNIYEIYTKDNKICRVLWLDRNRVNIMSGIINDSSIDIKECFFSSNFITDEDMVNTSHAINRFIKPYMINDHVHTLDEALNLFTKNT